MLQDFKDFALKGNAIALAVGLVMGVAFNAIVTSIVDNLFTPLIELLLGGISLADKSLTVMGVSFGWGAVVAAIINFLVVALSLFILVRLLSKLEKEADPTTRDCPFCTTEIAKAATRCPSCTSEVTAQA